MSKFIDSINLISNRNEFDDEYFTLSGFNNTRAYDKIHQVHDIDKNINNKHCIVKK